MKLPPTGGGFSAIRQIVGANRFAWLLVLPASLFITVFMLLPLLIMFRLSLNRFDPIELYVEAVTLENYLRFFSEPFFRNVLWTTFWISTVTTILCLIGGMPVAYYIARIRSQRLKTLLLIMVVLPLLMGNVVRTAGWMIVLDNRGVVNFMLAGIGADPLPLLYTPAAVLIGLTSVLLPFMIITLHSVLEGIDESLEEASLSLGASSFRSFCRIVIPLAMPGILAGSVLCFILSMNAYATPVLLGGPSFHMMAPAVYDQIAKSMNWPFGAALAFVLMAVTIILVMGSGFVFARRASA